MSCKHNNVVAVFTQSAICVDCGTPVCRICRGQTAKPTLPSNEICNVFSWQHALETNTWQGRALSYEDAARALGSAQLLCRYRSRDLRDVLVNN